MAMLTMTRCVNIYRVPVEGVGSLAIRAYMYDNNRCLYIMGACIVLEYEPN